MVTGRNTFSSLNTAMRTRKFCLKSLKREYYGDEFYSETHNNPAARATFTGMTMDTDRTDMTQAVLEGVAFAIRDSFEVAKSLGINVTETKICGGGAKSPLWRKMIANILNIKVSVPVTEEGPALGAAMLAAVGTGAYKNVEEAASHIVKIKETIEPDKEIAARYEKKYQQFKKIYPALKSVFDEFD